MNDNKCRREKVGRVEGRIAFSYSITTLFIFIHHILPTILLTSVSACAHKEPIKYEPILYPPPPEVARVKHIGIISSDKEVLPEPSLFEKFITILLGRKDSQRLEKPYGICIDKAQRLIVTDTSLKAIHIFDRNKGEYILIESTVEVPLYSPVGVATDIKNNIYVVDSFLRKVYIFNEKGKHIGNIEDRKLLRPTGIAINREKGLIYISDTMSHKIRVYTTGGEKLFDFGGRGPRFGEFNFPVHLALDSEGKIYVTDAMNFRIQIFDEFGNFLSVIGQLGDGPGNFSKPKGVATDSENHIYIVDALFGNVQIFNEKGELLLHFGGNGIKPGKFWLPSGIYIDNNDYIYVADTYNHRIQVFQYLSIKNNEEERNELDKN